MDEAQLRQQLEAKVLEKYAGAFQSMHERAKAEALLSDAEWLERRSPSSSMPSHFLEQYRAHALEHRYDQLHFIESGGQDLIVLREVDALLPLVVQARAESGAAGELTV